MCTRNVFSEKQNLTLKASWKGVLHSTWTNKWTQVVPFLKLTGIKEADATQTNAYYIIKNNSSVNYCRVKHDIAVICTKAISVLF